MRYYLICFIFSQARNYIQSLSYMPKMNFENVFIGANPLGKTWGTFITVEDITCIYCVDGTFWAAGKPNVLKW